MAFFLLVRHGQNDWVDKKRLAGWTPGIHLNDAGKKQVQSLSERLIEQPVKAIYSSPLERCIETADILASSHKLEVQILESVGEVRYGKWEGKELKVLSKKKRQWFAVQHFPSRFRFPGGETFQEVQERAVSAIESLNSKHLKEVIIVVSHADVIKLVLAHYLGVHIDLFQRITVSPASVNILALGKGAGVKVLRVNDTGALDLPDLKKRLEATAKSTGEESTNINGGIIDSSNGTSDDSA